MKLSEQRRREILTWMAGLIGADGHVSTLKRRSGKVLNSVSVSVASVELDWLKLIQQRAQDIGWSAPISGKFTGNIAAKAGAVRFAPTVRVYTDLSEVSEYMMRRKYARLVSAYGPVERLLSRLECYKLALAIPRTGKVTQGRKGSGVYGKMLKLSKQYGVPLNTIQFWYYNKQKPQMSWARGVLPRVRG